VVVVTWYIYSYLLCFVVEDLGNRGRESRKRRSDSPVMIRGSKRKKFPGKYDIV